ncbi:hypothetical protein Desdi_2553 [Desulfitobacterium dichloroeliminans LMG P-21439]|uniref:Uncharacterized protein n=1 Tax=Desulfitobacterium dichloroeliminans (strain LMG P-21439 / DCA1) TaxID=871963 RepID=L0FAK5_DESDL|nr:hypothetical protein [Desulfitobacterium dichloroeliminans]AGA69973.1 hypothetical protein Desdi_2553 [Desulfitobacterium dichloroeliminans LMG P-21439]
MTKVTINPGICGFITKVEASSRDGEEVTLKVASDCEAVQKMMKELGDTFDAFELCLTKPGNGPLFGFASQHFPVHAACPVIAGIIKCAEAECQLALPRNSEIIFE